MKHTFHRVLILGMIAVLALALGIAAAAATPSGFNAQIGIANPDENTMVVTIDEYSSDILAEHAPTLILPCTFTEAYVTYDGAVIASALDTDAGEIRFTPTAGGDYTVHAGKDPTAHVHTPVTDPAVPSTCTEDGKTEGSHCDTCGEVLTAQEIVPAAGHNYIDGSCTVCGGEDPDAPEEPTDPEDPADPEEPAITFTDVNASAYYAEAVQWAVAEGITNGVAENLFAPARNCTRGQAVTFLWRAAGCPAPKSAENPFSDIATGDFCYNAVLWAAEEGITAGVGGGRFAPNDTCTRGQIVTFLWRAAGCPAPEGNENPFGDVAKGAYYHDAVLWAVEEGITFGVRASSFAPGAICNRAQIVTFLYRSNH